MTDATHPTVEEHNRRQRRYFERVIKRTMVPVDTPYLRRQVEEVLRFAGPIAAGARVLEVGCGMGRYTLLLAARGIAVEGQDLSPVLLERLDGFNDGRFRIPLHCGDIAHPPPELVGAFDAALGFFVLHHIKDLDGSFAGIARVLKPGGRAVFLEPNPLNLLYYVQIAITPGMSWQGEGGMLQMRPRRLFRAMGQAGLVRPALARFGFFPPFLANRPGGARLERALESVPAWRPLLPFQLFRAERPAGQ